MAIDIQEFEKSTRPIFQTPIAVHQWDNYVALNLRLKALLLKLESEIPSDQRSNIGGWHSGENLFDNPDPAIQELKERVTAAIQSMTAVYLGEFLKPYAITRLTSWGNIVRNGHYHGPHTHPECQWSGVYYIDIGKPDPEKEFSGLLELLDPRGNNTTLKLPGEPSPREYIRPRNGMMVIFPNWINHMVHPFIGEGERITIAFNATLQQVRQEP